VVTILPQRGAQVTVLSAQGSQEVFEISANMMGLAVPIGGVGLAEEVNDRLGDLMKNLKATGGSATGLLPAPARPSQRLLRAAVGRQQTAGRMILSSAGKSRDTQN